MTKSMSFTFVIYICLMFTLVYGALNPDGNVINVAVVCVWGMTLMALFIAFMTVISLIGASELPDDKKKVTIEKVLAAFNQKRPMLFRWMSAVFPLIVVVCMAFSGWLITALCYLVGLVVVKVIKAVVLEYGKSCAG